MNIPSQISTTHSQNQVVSYQTLRKNEAGSLPALSYKAEIILNLNDQRYYLNMNAQPPKKSGNNFKDQGANYQQISLSNAINSIPSQPFESGRRGENDSINYLKSQEKSISQNQSMQTLEKEKQNILQPSQYINSLKNLAIAPKKKTRRHQTSFRIMKSNQNIQQLTTILTDFIQGQSQPSAQQHVNRQEMVMPANKAALFMPNTLEFADQLLIEKQIMKDKYGLDQKNAKRNNYLLEEVFLNRMEKQLLNRQQIQIQKGPLKESEINNEEIIVGNKTEEQGNDRFPIDHKKQISKELVLPQIQESANEVY